MPHRLEKPSLLFIGVLAISSAAILIKLCPDVPALVIAAWRLTWAALAMAAFTRLRGVRRTRMAARDVKAAVLGGLFLALHFMTWISSLKYTSVANSAVLVSTNPIFVALAAAVFFKEKQPRELIAGIGLCVGGCILLILVDRPACGGTWAPGMSGLKGDALALLGAVMASGYLLTGSRARAHLEVCSYAALVYSVAAVLLLGACAVLGLPLTGYGRRAYLYLFLLAMVPQLIGHTIINWALRHMRAGVVAIAIVGEPVGASILAYLIFGEGLRAWQLTGLALILAGILLALRRAERAP